MLKIEINNLKKYYGDRLIYNIDNLKIENGEKVGIVGVNGTGKSTLLDTIEGKVTADDGMVKVYGSLQYIRQGTSPSENNKSGGEETMAKINSAINKKPEVILMDEPTANLDISNTEKLIEIIKEFKGTVVIVSHHREILDVCSIIVEMSNGKVKVYKGNYSKYQLLKNKEIIRHEFEYNNYIKEKNKLLKSVKELEGKSKSVRKAPRRMGNSEARLHKMGDQKGRASLDKAKKAVESRLERLETTGSLETKEKPRSAENIVLDFKNNNELHSKVVIEGNNISKSFGDIVLFKNANFKIFGNTRTAIIGKNGTGKTTLIKMILEGEEGIKISKVAKIGYLAQDLSILNEDKSILENVMEDSIYDEKFCRKILSRLLFKREEVYKRISVLSGGEKMKVAFAKLILSDINLLIMDEPANYLDLQSMEALENVLASYKGTLIFVSHDLSFINKVATNVIILENQKLISYKGNYSEYKESPPSGGYNREIEGEILLLENRLNEIIGLLSIKKNGVDLDKLNEEYYTLVEKVKKLKINITK